MSITVCEGIKRVYRQRYSLTLTHSSRMTYLACPKKYWFRNVRSLVPVQERIFALEFGNTIHNCLESWHTSYDPAAVYNIINAAYPDIMTNADEKASWHQATACMRAYMDKYGIEQWTDVRLEAPFAQKITNPHTGRGFKNLTFAGVRDGRIFYEPIGNCVIEHKTTRWLTEDYIESKWNDPQIFTYALQSEREEGIQIDGFIYNILAQPNKKMAQRVGESEQEYQIKYADACAKNKSGKSTLQRILPETDAEYQERLAQFYTKPEHMVRLEILVDRKQLREIEFEIWETTHCILDSIRLNRWPRNRNNCKAFHHTCGYFDVCGEMDPIKAEALYAECLTIEEAHSEVRRHQNKMSARADDTATMEAQPTHDYNNPIF